MDSPVGDIRAAADERGLVAVVFAGRNDGWLDGDGTSATSDILVSSAARGARPSETVAIAVEQLREYFAGRRRNFDLPLAPRGTDLQRQVWHALAKIPYGTTVSYGELAAKLGRPQAQRAVGAANARNPLSIVLPCHRVVGAGGALTGYAGGLDVKRWLLEHEGVPVG
jgi:methylated-DNA-[protein]-cysteine S-methyltransferase